MTLAAEITPRQAPPGEPVEYEVTVSDDGVPVFVSWQPFENAEAAKERVVQLFSNVEPVICTITDLAGRKHVEEVR